MHISKSIIDNIGDDVIRAYLKTKKVSASHMENGQTIENILAEFIDSDEIHEIDVREFFFKKLMYGKRTYIRLYKFENCEYLSYQNDWIDVLKEKYEIPSLNFNNILNTFVNEKEPQKIAAIQTEINDMGEIDKICIMFVCYIRLKNNDSSCTYIPIEYNLKDKIIVAKGWRRRDVEEKDIYKPAYLIDKIIIWFDDVLHYEKKEIGDRYKEILYNMTEGLVGELFNKIPTYTEVNKFEDYINNFSNMILNNMSLENRHITVNGEYDLPIGIMDIKDEMYKMLQRLVVSDYFF